MTSPNPRKRRGDRASSTSSDESLHPDTPDRPRKTSRTRHRFNRSLVKDKARAQFGDNNTYQTINGPYYAQAGDGALSLSASSEGQRRQEYMDLLKFEDMYDRYDDVKVSHPRTCRWLLRRAEYRNWREDSMLPEHRGFMWIRGHPGSGKSTLMKFAVTAGRKDWRSDIVISYFFNARGVALEKSINGMLRSLLHQVFEKLGDSHPVFETLLARGCRLNALKTETLKDALRLVVECLDQQPLTCYVDALDECDDDDVWDLISYLQELGKLALETNVKLYVCFSSRYYPHLTINDCQHLVLEDQDEHDADIERYVQSELTIGQSALADEIKREIQIRARGIFLWVVLVVRVLNPLWHQGRVHVIRERLNKIPDKLNEFFQDLIQRGTTDRAQVALTLQWVLYAKRPLKCEELYFAILSGTDNTALRSWDKSKLTRQDMQRFILDCSKGLAETSKGSHATVQFIHESVREYLMRDAGLPTLQPDLVGRLEGASHECLRRCCEDYLSISPSPIELSRKPVEDRHPFLPYAVSGLLYHADAAHRHGLTQDQFVADFKLAEWITRNNLFENFRIRRYGDAATKAYVFADQSLPSLLEIAIAGHTDFDSRLRERFGTPLGAAAYHGTTCAVILLLKHGAGVEDNGASDLSAFDFAVKKGHTKIVKLLLEHGPSLRHHPRREPREGARLVYKAAFEGHTDIVRVLLDNDAPLDYSKGKFGTALQAASVKGDKATVQLLIQRRADLDVTAGWYGTALHAACYEGHKEIAELLLTAGANVNTGNDQYATPLHAASMRTSEGIVELLLKHGAKADAENPSLGTPLQAASSRAPMPIVELLLGQSEGASLSCNEIEACTRAASLTAHPEVREFWFMKCANIDVATSNGAASYSPLQSAASFGRLDAVRLLLEYGADPDFQPVSAAGLHGKRLTADKKLRRSWLRPFSFVARVLSVIHGSALHRAASGGHEQVVELLLSKGAAPNARHCGCGTALDVAIREKRKYVVDVLLAYDADVNPATLCDAAGLGYDKVVERILSGETMLLSVVHENVVRALQIALHEGHERVVKLLLDNSDEMDLPSRLRQPLRSKD